MEHKDGVTTTEWWGTFLVQMLAAAIAVLGQMPDNPTVKLGSMGIAAALALAKQWLYERGRLTLKTKQIPEPQGLPPFLQGNPK